MRHSVWRFVAVSGVAAIILYAATPLPGSTPMYLLIGAGSAIATAFGAATIARRGGDAAPWRAFALALAAFTIGDTFGVIQSSEPWPDLSPASISYLAAYTLIAIGLTLLSARGRGFAHGRAAVIDAAIFAVSGGMLLWVHLFSPVLAERSLGSASLLLTVAYAATNLLLLALTAHLALRGELRSGSGRLLGAGITAMLIANAVVVLDANRADTAFVAALLYLTTFVFVAAAALHPDRLLPAPPRHDRLTPARITMLTAAVLVGPILVLLPGIQDGSVSEMVVGGGAALVALLVLTRISALAARLDDALARYRTLVEQIPAVVFTDPLGAPGAFSYVSPRIMDILGYTPTEWIRHWPEGIHPDDRSAVLAAIAEADRTLQPFRMEFRYRARDGRWVWLRDEASLAHGDDDRPRYWQGVLVDVTDIKHAEAALVESEQRFRGAFEGATIGMVLIGLDGRYLQVNPAFPAIVGYSASELLTMHFDDIVHPDDLARKQHLRAALLNGETPSSQTELRYYHKDGRIVWAQLSLVLVRDLDDAPRYFISQIQDITRAKAAEAALAAERDLLRSLLDHLPGAAYVKDAETRFVRINPATAEQLGGVAPADAIGKTDADFFPPSAAARFAADDRRVLDGSEILNQVESQGDGDEARIVLSSKVPLRNGDGDIVGLVGLNRDVTEQIRTETALREAESLYGALVEHLPLIVYVQPVGDPARMGYVSPYVRTMFGFTPEDWRPGFADRLHPEDRGRVLAEVERSEITGEPFRMAYRERARDGHYLWVRDETVLVRDETGAPDYWLGAKVDISAQKLLEDELRATRDAAEAASQAKSNFLSTMSHELRTPMNAIVGYTHLLLEGMSGPLLPEQEADVRQIADGADRLLTLINDVLDLARIEAGRITLELEPVDLIDIAAQAHADIAPMAARKGLSLTLETPPALPALRADRARLHQILLNLVGNAVKFTQDGGVRISARETGEAIELMVADTGVGIAPEALDRIFDEFEQADTSTTRRFGGTGLGLAITRRLVELHGGTIGVTSAPGVGSTFTVTLPIVAAALQTEGAPGAEPVSAARR
ncbi:MAG: PAS domain S-box protein [Thermomicrobiales bacterium]|nr:PAS domain S-box protein [Thermomicrobiales bacterium]